MAHPFAPQPNNTTRSQEWRSRLSITVGGLLLFETLTGLSIWLLPFNVPNQFAVLLHTIGGLAFLIPYLVYQIRHWMMYRGRAWSHYMLTGYVACAAVALNATSGVILTWQAIFGTLRSYAWDTVHIVTTLVIMAFVIPHVAFLFVRSTRSRAQEVAEVRTSQRRWLGGTLAWTAGGAVVLIAASLMYQPVTWVNEFPEGYEVQPDRSPFSPSLATTVSGGAYDERSLAGSQSCGTSGCHQQIYEEWAVSAHRWSSMDPAFQVIQEVMAKQNGPTSTRYCGGCHDPISLFSGTKNVLTDDLSSLHGYNEGVSCLVCHSIRETDLKGNANYQIQQPVRYAFEDHEEGVGKFLSDFLIRSYPKQHMESYSKRLFKTPEYCAACHKQFIDEEVNEVGWVQLQNQYDNWRKSKWNPEDEPEMVVECRECHMPLLDSTDPAAGDDADSYRHKGDGKHRDHRFIAANTLIPELLELPNWQEHKELTEAWLQGRREIPEIEHKWAHGPAVSIEIQAPDTVRVGERMDIRVVITSNKVGHDFPTGPLDIIQSWINLEVTDEAGNVVFASGSVDEEHFIEPGSFMFKAEPVDRYGALIDRHNLWEMVGVRYRRALFPGFSDVAKYSVTCPTTLVDSGSETADDESPPRRDFTLSTPNGAGRLFVRASLDYRKIDQYLLDFVFGEENKLTAPIVRMATQNKIIWVDAS